MKFKRLVLALVAVPRPDKTTRGSIRRPELWINISLNILSTAATASAIDQNLTGL